MLRLALIRHAKAGPHTSAAKDHERPLDDRGRDDAKALGQRLAAKGLRPDLVLCSTAKRTNQTFKRLNRAFDPPLNRVEEAQIYEAPADRIIDLIRRAPSDVQFLALVGHNPGFEDAVRMLLDENGREAWRARGDAMPTGCAAIMEGDAANWSAVLPGSMRLVQVMTPSDEAD